MHTVLFILFVIALYLVAHNLLTIYYLRLLAMLRAPAPMVPAPAVRKLSIILPVFNEERTIVRKMENIREALAGLTTPAEVLIGCDGSEDATGEEADRYLREHQLSGWRVFRFAHEGKGSTINNLVGLSDGEIIVSTDADTRMERDALRVIVRRFEDDASLGCLSCVPVFQGANLRLQGLYWNIEMKMRDAESALGRLIVVTGWLYAFRRSLFQDIPAGAMADDLWVPLTVLLHGARCEHSRQLPVLSEKTSEKMEVTRRKRVISGGADVVRRLAGKISRDPLVLFLVFSHKVNKWLLSLWLGLLLLTSVLLVPAALLVYGLLALVLLVALRPRRFVYLLESVFSPIGSLRRAVTSVDLSKWRHTRES